MNYLSLIILGLGIALLLFLPKTRFWILKAEPQGLGTLLIGLAAVLALFQTSDILSRILRIQEQAGQIEKGVGDL